MDVNSLWNVKARAGVAHHWVTHVYKAWVYLHINIHNFCHEIMYKNKLYLFQLLDNFPKFDEKAFAANVAVDDVRVPEVQNAHISFTSATFL